MNKDELENLAKKTRKEFDDKSVPQKLLAKLYLDYNPNIEDIDSFLLRALDLFPRLNCGLAAVYLRRKIGGGEVVQGTYRGNKHTFLVYSGKIIDITADQYGGPKIHVGPLAAPWSFEKTT